jgi:hypothetical protein
MLVGYSSCFLSEGQNMGSEKSPFLMELEIREDEV